MAAIDAVLPNSEPLRRFNVMSTSLERGELRLNPDHVYRLGGIQRLDLTAFPEPTAALFALESQAVVRINGVRLD